MRKGEGEVQKSINELLRKKSRTTEELADALDANRQYIRKVLRELIRTGKVVKTGVASPKGGCTYKRKR